MKKTLRNVIHKSKTSTVKLLVKSALNLLKLETSTEKMFLKNVGSGTENINAELILK